MVIMDTAFATFPTMDEMRTIDRGLRGFTPVVRAGSNWHTEDVVICGSDWTVNRANQSRPEAD